MAKRLIINMGFITNSSSAIHWFPKEILEDPEVRTFMEAYGLGGGYVGSELWHRGACESLLITPEQKQEARERLNDTEYSPGTGDRYFKDADNQVILIYGDEYSSVTSELASLLSDVARKKGLAHSSDEYN